MQQQRGFVRYTLVAPVVFSWETREGERVQDKGATLDISEAGAFIVAAVCPPAMVPVKVEIFLPLPGPAGRTLRLTAVGQVVRSCVGEAPAGFAVVSQGFDIPELAFDGDPGTLE